MKKLLLISISVFSANFITAQTATNFTANDCAGTSHDLYTELDAGKVIVLDFVMPCSTCIAPSQTAYNIAQSYATSNPGRVKYYLSSDDGNDACSAISSWGSTNSITSPDAVFATTSVVEASFGTGGMPKIVVIGRSTHKIFYTHNGAGISSSALQTAIDSALVPASPNSVTGPTEKSSIVSVIPNPVVTTADLVYSLPSNSFVTIQLYNILGEKMRTVFTGLQSAGNNRFNMNCTELENGIYFAKIITGEGIRTLKFSVSH